MQPSKRARPAAQSPHSIVASHTVGESGLRNAAALPAVLEGRIQSAGAVGPFVVWNGAAAPVMARVLWMERAPDWSKCIDLRVALVFEGGDAARPVVVGLLDAPPPEALARPS